MMTVVNGDRATCSGRSPGKPIKVAAFVVPNIGMGLDDIGDDEGGLWIAGDDRSRPAVALTVLQENRAWWLVGVTAGRNLSGQYVVGGGRVRDRGSTARAAAAHNWPVVTLTASDSTCKAVALGHRACAIQPRGRAGKEGEEAREGRRRFSPGLVAGGDTCNVAVVGGEEIKWGEEGRERGGKGRRDEVVVKALAGRDAADCEVAGGGDGAAKHRKEKRS